MQKRCSCVALAVAGFALSPAAAQSATNGITYDCDTAANHYSELVLPAPAGAFVVNGKVALNAVAASDKYLPLARLAISNASETAGPSNEDWTGFEYNILPKSKDIAKPLPVLSYSVRAGGRKIDPEIIGLPSASNVAFSLSFDGSHVTLNVDGHEKQLPFTAAKPVVRIVCSTGEFLFTGLLITPRRYCEALR